MRIVALDYGSKRVGVAVSDPLGLIAQPLATLDHDQVIPQLTELLKQYDRVDELVVGLPKRLSGELGPAADKVLAFVHGGSRKDPDRSRSLPGEAEKGH